MLVNIGEGGKPGGEWSNTGGHYEDMYVKTTQGWKFKRREYIPMKSERRAPAAGAPAGAPPAAAKAAAGTSASTPAAARAGALTAQDYIDIRALASLYAYGLDSGAENGTGSVYANIFTEDAEFHGPPATPGGAPFNAAGREELRKFAVPGRGTAYVRHFMTNHLIEPSPEGARGKVYLLVIDIGREDKPTSVNMGGHYEDIYVKTAEGWRIKSRNFFRSKSAQTVAAEAAATARPMKTLPACALIVMLAGAGVMRAQQPRHPPEMFRSRSSASIPPSTRSSRRTRSSKPSATGSAWRKARYGCRRRTGRTGSCCSATSRRT